MDSNTFYKKLNNSKYGKQYLELVLSGEKTREYKKGYERHHIHPRALGGSNQIDNLVRLTVFDHILAHIYLAKAIPCCSTMDAVVLMSGQQKRHISDLENITLDEVYGWSELRRKARSQYVCPHSAERISKFVKKSKETRIAKYGSLMGPALSPEVIKQRLEKVAKNWGGDSAGQLHTEEIKKIRISSMQEKYGGCTKHMQSKDVVEKARQTRIRNAELSHRIMKVPEYLEWFKNSNYNCKYRAVVYFLRERKQTREEYLGSVGF